MKIEDTGWQKTHEIFNAIETVRLKRYFDEVNTEQQKVYQLSKKDHELDEIKKAIQVFSSYVSGSDIYSGVKLSKIWYVTTSESNSEPGKLPYIPHFDKRRFIKLMVYLNDVGSSDGPFTTASHPVNLYEDERKRLPDNYKELGLNSEIKKHSYSEVTFTAGSGIIFDTNCAHFAKPVEPGGGRLALRFDFENYEWNKSFDNFLTQIRRKFF